MKRLLTSFSSLIFLFIYSSNSHAQVDLWDWGINLDGTSYCFEGPCSSDFLSIGDLSSLADLPSSIDYSAFNLRGDDANDFDGFGSLNITVTGAGAHSVSVYLNYDLDYSTNGELNETGTSFGTAPLGLSWEIDEIGWGNAGSLGTAGSVYTGDIFDNFIDSGVVSPPTSYLDNQIFFDQYPLPDGQSLVPPIEDAALAQSWDFDLLEGQTAIITFTAGPTVPSGFYLVQQDPDTGTNVYLTSSVSLYCEGGVAVDDCGVCGGDNSTCAQATPHDLNGDSKSDILLKNSSNGLMWRFRMNGSSIEASNSVAQLSSVWEIKGLADLNADKKADIVLQHTDGLLYLFQMNDNIIESSAAIATLENNVEAVGLGDFNGDTIADILIRDTTSGQLSILIMDGNIVQETIPLITMSLDWQVAAVADFGGDKNADILLRKSDGLLWLLQVAGSSVAHSNGIAQLNPNWQVAAGADYNGDGKADILLHNSSNGLFWLYQMNGYSIENSRGIAVLNTAWQVAASGDYNGDSKADILLRNPGTGLLWLWQMNGHSIENSQGVALINSVWEVVQ